MYALLLVVASVLLTLISCSPSAPAATPAPAGGVAAAPAQAPQPDPAPEPGGEPARGGGGGGGGGGQAGRGGQAQEAGPRPYDRVITSEAQTRTGMFTVHRIGERLLFEIPRDQLGKDLLLVTEIAQTALGSGYGGQAISNRVYRLERRGNRVFLRGVAYTAVADPNTREARAVEAANVNPIVATFNVEAYGRDSTMVIDVSRLFTQPPTELSVGNAIPGNIDATRSMIERAIPYPDNVNVYAMLTFAQQGGGRAAAAPAGGRAGNTNPTNTVVVSWSFHRLPDVPMQARLCDDRVGYFSQTFTDYTDDDDRVRQRCYITRYRLEKRNPNAAISDPVKPIIFYIDPATPERWVPYFKRGVEAWQDAFREAGFSNAIVAMDAPNDPDWSPEDARVSVIRWLPSTTQNASGPHVHDPRSGEILNAHIQWYQNVSNLQNTWYFTQASAVDPRARQFPLPEDLMGRLLEFVVSHEVGHTLGLQHNMKASSAYPVDSLRSASFLRQWGHTPSIMDYSRFNYVAQPEDRIPVELLVPRVGPYDKFAIKWGYAPLNAASPEAERTTLDLWAREQDTKPWLRFSTSGSAGTDPGELTEAVGESDPVKATGYGLQNIKREVAYLIGATTTKPTEGYDDLASLYGGLVGQWRTELNHVANLIGGADSQEKYASQQGVRFTPVSKARQKEAIAFLNANAFTTPEFFLVDDIVRRMEPTGSVARIHAAQAGILNSVLQNARLLRLSEYSHGQPAGQAYSIMELLADVRAGLFSELAQRRDIDVYRRSLQRAYVESLDNKINPPPPAPAAGGGGGGGGGGGRAGGAGLAVEMSDIHPAVRSELQALDAELAVAIANTSGLTRAHLEDLRHRIELALKGEPAPRLPTIPD